MKRWKRFVAMIVIEGLCFGGLVQLNANAQEGWRPARRARHPGPVQEYEPVYQQPRYEPVYEDRYDEPVYRQPRYEPEYQDQWEPQWQAPRVREPDMLHHHYHFFQPNYEPEYRPQYEVQEHYGQPQQYYRPPCRQYVPPCRQPVYYQQPCWQFGW